jgi:hypothetical protein
MVFGRSLCCHGADQLASVGSAGLIASASPPVSPARPLRSSVVLLQSLTFMPIGSCLSCQIGPPLLRNPGLRLCHPQMRPRSMSSWAVTPVSPYSQLAWHPAWQRLEDEGERLSPWAIPWRSSPRRSACARQERAPLGLPDQPTYRLTVAWRGARRLSDGGGCVPSGVHSEQGVVRRCGLSRLCQAPAVQVQHPPERLREPRGRSTRRPRSACISSGCRMAVWRLRAAVSSACSP